MVRWAVLLVLKHTVERISEQQNEVRFQKRSSGSCSGSFLGFLGFFERALFKEALEEPKETTERRVTTERQVAVLQKRTIFLNRRTSLVFFCSSSNKKQKKKKKQQRFFFCGSFKKKNGSSCSETHRRKKRCCSAVRWRTATWRTVLLFEALVSSWIEENSVFSETTPWSSFLE